MTKWKDIRLEFPKKFPILTSNAKEIHVVYEDENSETYYTGGGTGCYYCGGNPQCVSILKKAFEEDYQFTYWMELPELPK